MAIEKQQKAPADDLPTLAPAPSVHLVVLHAFGGYRKGDRISDAAEIAAVLAGENSPCVNKVAA